jgi:hypothetical protein
VIAETSQFADHLARPHLLRLFADGWSAFLVPKALVQDLPNETTEPVSDGANRLGVPEAWDERYTMAKIASVMWSTSVRMAAVMLGRPGGV